MNGFTEEAEGKSWADKSFLLSILIKVNSREGQSYTRLTACTKIGWGICWGQYPVEQVIWVPVKDRHAANRSLLLASGLFSFKGDEKQIPQTNDFQLGKACSRNGNLFFSLPKTKKMVVISINSNNAYLTWVMNYKTCLFVLAWKKMDRNDSNLNPCEVNLQVLTVQWP